MAFQIQSDEIFWFINAGGVANTVKKFMCKIRVVITKL